MGNDFNLNASDGFFASDLRLDRKPGILRLCNELVNLAILTHNAIKPRLASYDHVVLGRLSLFANFLLSLIHRQSRDSIDTAHENSDSEGQTGCKIGPHGLPLVHGK